MSKSDDQMVVLFVSTFCDLETVRKSLVEVTSRIKLYKILLIANTH